MATYTRREFDRILRYFKKPLNQYRIHGTLVHEVLEEFAASHDRLAEALEVYRDIENWVEDDGCWIFTPEGMPNTKAKQALAGAKQYRVTPTQRNKEE